MTEQNYIWDPEHKKNPGSGFFKTDKGWSNKKTAPKSGMDEEIKKALNSDPVAFRRLNKTHQIALIRHHDGTIKSAISMRENFIKKYGVHWFKIISPIEKNRWAVSNMIMNSSIVWARRTIGGDRWWNLPCVREERAKHQNEIPTKYKNTEERKELQSQIAKKLYNKGSSKKERKLFIVMGLPGAGKSKVVVNRIIEERGALAVDADMAKEFLPEFNGGSGAGIVHAESAEIAEKRILPMCRSQGDNIVFPTVGKNQDKLKFLIQDWKNHGYEVNLSLVDIDIDSSIERSLTRWVQTGRFVDPAYITEHVGERPVNNFHALKSYCDNFEYWNNEVPIGEKPILVEKGKKMANNHSSLTKKADNAKVFNMKAENCPVEELDETQIYNIFILINKAEKIKGRNLTFHEINAIANKMPDNKT
ncbi:MAG: zeta toxin family protein [Paludibacteraceae bacterium]|nr:zeta toxin family protein [Paludibacteraceae bacterium]MCK9615899.1 zeta toxin family protein [Candidatus Omnitrophota bacterium]